MKLKEFIKKDITDTKRITLATVDNIRRGIFIVKSKLTALTYKGANMNTKEKFLNILIKNATHEMKKKYFDKHTQDPIAQEMSQLIYELYGRGNVKIARLFNLASGRDVKEINMVRYIPYSLFKLTSNPNSSSYPINAPLLSSPNNINKEGGRAIMMDGNTGNDLPIALTAFNVTLCTDKEIEDYVKQMFAVGFKPIEKYIMVEMK
jgi:hypothetical protein